MHVRMVVHDRSAGRRGAALGLALLILVGLAAGGCTPNTHPAETPAAQTPVTPAATIDPAVDAATRGAIETVVAQRQAAVLKHDKDSFLATVDGSNTTYLVEQRHWFEDVAHTVTEFSLQAKDMKRVAADAVRVTLTESFSLKSGEKHTLTFDKLYRLRGESWKDSDYPFEELRGEHITVRYQGTAEMARAALDAEAADLNYLRQTFGWQPASDIVIKLYTQKDLFLYDIKPSLPTWVGGWDEANESIKFRISDHTKFVPAGGLLHESTHQMLFALSNNNASYWLQEGLASWVPRSRTGDFGLAKLRDAVGAKPWTLPELEAKNLETLDSKDAMIYYGESMLVAKYLMDTYGVEKLKAITAELAQHPENAVTVAETIPASNRLTEAAISNVTGLRFDQFAEDWYAWAKDLLSQAN